MEKRVAKFNPQIKDAGKVHIRVFNYEYKGRMALAVHKEDGSPWGMLSVNLVDYECGPLEFFAKEYAENEGWSTTILDKLQKRGFILYTGKVASFGFVNNIRKFKVTQKFVKQME